MLSQQLRKKTHQPIYRVAGRSWPF